MLDKRLATICGIGEKKAQLLEKLGLFTLRDVLFFLPRDYQDFSKITLCAALEEGEQCVLVRFITEARVAYPRRGLSIVSAQAQDETGRVKIVWYNQPYRKKSVVSGQSVLIYGKVSKKNGQYTFENPDIEAVENLGEHSKKVRGILPIYSLTAGIGQKTMRSIVQICLEMCFGHVQETLPQSLKEQYGLCEINFAIENVHYPLDQEVLEQARRRLSMEELFFFLLAVGWMEKTRKEENGIAYITDGHLQEFLQKISFELTEAQNKALLDIEQDMSKVVPMNRLIQGDVGSGKTILAFYAMYIANCNGYQSVLLAPTEILARQHVKEAQKIFGLMAGIECLVGGMKKKERDALLERIASGQSRMIIATHAVLQDDIEFANLGLVITDEQHRFGVRQRATLTRKEAVDILIMSATPIPRTLTLILYGDLDVTIMKGLPPGRKPIATHYVPPKKRDDLYRYIQNEAKKGNQSYIVAPLIEESDAVLAQSAQALYDELKEGALNDVDVDLLHGRMQADEKMAVLENFRKGETQVLVTTTVIEVGVDVPQATIIAIEGVDRFGLAQLHQLRGRVGRGQKQSYCFLLSQAASEDVQKRIDILCKSSDGFVIAQKDLELRGPGEFLGTRQSGLGNFRLAHLASDMFMLEEARSMVHDVLKNPKYEEERPLLLEQMQRIYQEKLREIAWN